LLQLRDVHVDGEEAGHERIKLSSDRRGHAPLLSLSGAILELGVELLAPFGTGQIAQMTTNHLDGIVYDHVTGLKHRTAFRWLVDRNHWRGSSIPRSSRESKGSSAHKDEAKEQREDRDGAYLRAIIAME
jgi:hypothetical protein